jgi:hypothetical protein
MGRIFTRCGVRCELVPHIGSFKDVPVSSYSELADSDRLLVSYDAMMQALPKKMTIALCC